MRIHGIANESIVDGPGFRFALFVQGCPHHCRGCHNPESWSYESGTEADINALAVQATKNPLAAGISISGGEPFTHVEECKDFIDAVKALRPEYTVWIWSGWTYDELVTEPSCLSLLEKCDVLVDGKFKEELYDVDLQWCGSSNQRVIDVKKTLKQGEVAPFSGDDWSKQD